MTAHMKHKHLLIFGSFMVVAWAVGTFLFIYFWPHIVLNHFRKAILDKGFGGGPVPINTLYTEPQNLFADPITAQSASASNLMTTGVNHDTLLTGGWLDLSKGALVLHVPAMPDRYYSVQFTDSADGTDFAYVGTRTTGSQAGDYLITGPGWKGTVPQGMKQISSPNNSVLVIGRVLVESDSDLATAYGLAKQIQLTPLSAWQPGK
jgi:hypothetical protein